MGKYVFEQGCTYDPKITIEIDGKVPTEQDVAKIHFRFGSLIKSFPDSKDVKLENGMFSIHLSSQDTLNMPPNIEHEIEVIVVFPKGETKPVKDEDGEDLGTFIVEPTGFPREVFENE